MNLLQRGDVVALRAPQGAKGHQRKGARYGVILQSSELSGLSTVVVAPTSTNAQASNFRPEVKVRGRRTRVLVDQLRTVDREHVGPPAGYVAAHELRNLDDALKVVLGLF